MVSPEIDIKELMKLTREELITEIVRAYEQVVAHLDYTSLLFLLIEHKAYLKAEEKLLGDIENWKPTGFINETTTDVTMYAYGELNKKWTAE